MNVYKIVVRLCIRRYIFFVVTFAFPSIEIHLAVCIFMRINDVLFIYVVRLCFSSMYLTTYYVHCVYVHFSHV